MTLSSEGLGSQAFHFSVMKYDSLTNELYTTENNTGTLESREWKTREWKLRHQTARLDWKSREKEKYGKRRF